MFYEKFIRKAVGIGGTPECADMRMCCGLLSSTMGSPPYPIANWLTPQGAVTIVRSIKL
jgi:hypothetical protein